MENTFDTTVGVSDQQNWMTFFKSFTILCIGFTATTVFTIFFEEDLFRIFTPFFAPFILLFVFLGYLVLALSSIVYIPFQIKKVSWRVFLPISINLTTFLVIYYLYDVVGDLRIDIGFRIKEQKFNQVSTWVTQSIQNGDLIIGEKEETVFLPKEYRDLTSRDRVYVTQENGAIRIFFSRGGGGFEYYPGYMYHSANISPPIEDGDIVCIRRIKPNWYDCY